MNAPPHRVARAAATILLPLLSLACDAGVAPDVGRVQIDPPSLYRTLWDGVESCSGLIGPFARVRWFIVYEFGSSSTIFGQWNQRREITLRSDVWLDSDVIRHEILHDLLNGDGGHTRDEWDACDIDPGVPEGS